MRWTVLLLAGVLWQGPLLAQDGEAAEHSEIFARGCGDDNGVDRCDPQVQQGMRELYGVESAEALVASGVTAYRAMFVDGYGRDIAIVSFMREPGVSPYVDVRSPTAGGATARSEPLRTPIGNATWIDVIESAENFDQKLAREIQPAEDDGLIWMCLHGWFVVAEAAVAPRVDQNVLAGTSSMDAEREVGLSVEPVIREGSVRRDAESSCANGLAVDFAFELADLAASNLPQCDTFDPEEFRNLPMMLLACALSSGDRIAAGSASGLVTKLERALKLENDEELKWLFVGFGDERARRFTAAIEGGTVYFGPPVGLDTDHARVEGKVYFRNGVSDTDREVSDITLNLLRQSDDFVIDTFQVGERKPYPR